MELVMKTIPMCRQAKHADTEITLEEDLNVPDAKPDVDVIIQSRERTVVEHTRAEAGRLYLDGFLEVSVLYLEDTKERRLSRLDARLPFDESMAVEGLEPGENVRVRSGAEDLNVSLINSRKLSIRALLHFEASVEEIYEISAAVEVQTEAEVCVKKKKLDLLQLQVQKKDILRLKEDFPLPSNKPDIGEILWESIRLRSCRIHLLDGKLSVEGSLSLFVLYRAEDEGQSRQWLEQTIPFESVLGCGGCRPGLSPDIETVLSQAELTVRDDPDGEPRLFHLEGVLDLSIRLYAVEETEILSDLYSPEKDLELVTEDQICESLVVRNESKCRASGKLRVQGAKPRILQICHGDGSIRVDNTELVEDGVRVEGALLVSILYISPDDARPFAVLEGAVPFSHAAEAPGIGKDCRFSLTANLEQLSAAMTDSEEIEIRASIGLNLFAVRPAVQKCIREVQEKEYSLEQLEAVPGITGYIVQEGESLWDIAKRYYLTPERIAAMNGLESEKVKKGDCLILMKNVAAFQ